ncbi:unnamed protein product [Schistosoma mattheei]|uniref:Uncharacterized protein n=1 Tax=Schistosoma mattheei TaxID=31246 RepID=A0AA85C1A9_9TREM|nr:unnamed protein product [Schistosoma mattheei]
MNINLILIVIFILLNRLNGESHINKTNTTTLKTHSTQTAIPMATTDLTTSIKAKMTTTVPPLILIYWNDSESRSRPKKWITMWSVVFTTVFIMSYQNID